jgi:hypothetical protein
VREERPSTKVQTREGTRMDFLAERCAVFGITLQCWMPIMSAWSPVLLYLRKRGLLNQDGFRHCLTVTRLNVAELHARVGPPFL